MKTRTLGFIGGGRITKIFLKAFQNKQAEFKSITVCDTNPDALTSLKSEFPQIETCNMLDLPARQDVVFIALHPPVIMETLENIKNQVTEKTLVISLAPKINMEKIAGKLAVQNIARMIPNATSYINEGYNPICFADSFSKEEKKTVLDLVGVLGKTFEVDEAKLESYALVSAMLPTYFWFQWKEMQEIGQQFGLSPAETSEAIRETLEAANHLYFDSGLDSAQVIDLIPVKPIAEHEEQIKECLKGKLLPLFEKIKP